MLLRVSCVREEEPIQATGAGESHARGENATASSVLRRDRKIECRALAQFAFRPNYAVAALDDALDVGQSEAGSGKFGIQDQALEGVKHLLRILLIEPDAFVSEEEGRAVFGGFLAKGDLAPIRGKLTGV